MRARSGPAEPHEHLEHIAREVGTRDAKHIFRQDPSEGMMINPPFAIALAIAMLWTTAFSMTNRFPLRSLRNLGILACYVIGLVMFFRVDLKSALATWILFGLIGGGLYFIHDLIARARTKEGEEKSKISLAHFVFGQLAWPIMGPEAIEYSLAELGILKAPEAPPPADAMDADVAPDDGQASGAEPSAPSDESSP